MKILFYIISYFVTYWFINISYANEIGNISTEALVEDVKSNIKEENNLLTPLMNNESDSLQAEKITPSVTSNFIVNLEVNHENTNILSTVIKNHLNHLLIPAEDLQNLDISPEYLNRGSVYLEREFRIRNKGKGRV